MKSSKVEKHLLKTTYINKLGRKLIYLVFASETVSAMSSTIKLLLLMISSILALALAGTDFINPDEFEKYKIEMENRMTSTEEPTTIDIGNKFLVEVPCRLPYRKIHGVCRRVHQ
ncbi:hypothetical protein JTB14_005015 [Gonioctena quinquepunctata]|nr:hypothetical protein JTB14_005015 [Gonioctena quinquepunctata]